MLKDPIFIEALPGIGNVGKIAGDFVADALKAERFATIYSENFPPQVVPDQECVVKMACNELWHARGPKGRDIVFLRGDYQGGTPEGQFALACDVMDVILSFGVSTIITLGGYGTGLMPGEVHVFGAVSRRELKPALEKAGVTFRPGEPQAGIVGASGALVGLGQANGIDSFCLMGETSGFFADQKSALAVIEVLRKILGIRRRLDLAELEEQSRKIDELAERVNSAEPAPAEDLNYIG